MGFGDSLPDWIGLGMTGLPLPSSITDPTGSFEKDNPPGPLNAFGGVAGVLPSFLSFAENMLVGPHNRRLADAFRQEEEAIAEGVRTDIRQTGQEAAVGTRPGVRREVTPAAELRSEILRVRGPMSIEALNAAVRERQLIEANALGLDPATGRPRTVTSAQTLTEELDTALTARDAEARASATKISGLAQGAIDTHEAERGRIAAEHEQRVARARQQMQDLIAGYQGRLETGFGLLSGSGTQEREDINRQFDQFGGAIAQDLTSRGATGSTIGVGLQAGLERTRADALGGAEERLRQQQVDLFGEFSGDTLRAQLVSIGLDAGLTGEQIDSLVGRMEFGAGLSGEQIGVEERLRTSTADLAGQDAAARFGAGQLPIGINIGTQDRLTEFETTGVKRFPPEPVSLFGF